MLEPGITRKEKTVIQDDGTAPVCGIHQNQMLVCRFQYQDAVPGVFRFDCGFAGNLAAHGFSEQVAHSLNTGGGIYVSQHPLHGSGLDGHISLAQVADHLTLTHIHFTAEIGHCSR